MSTLIADVLQLIYADERQRLLEFQRYQTGDYLNPVFGVGSECPTILFIGEAPGAQEVLMQKPFVGKAGMNLNAMLNTVGLSRDDVYVTNVIKFRPLKYKLLKNGKQSPSNRTPRQDEVLSSLATLNSELRTLNPKVVVTLGNVPLYAMSELGKFNLNNGTIGDLHGKPYEIVTEKLNLTLYPLYHPAGMIYNKTLIPAMDEDLLGLKEFLNV